MKNKLSKEVFDKAMIVHLRGGIDYSKLGLKHKTMKGMLYKKAVTLPEEKKNAEVKVMITNVVFGFRCRQKGGFDHE